MCIRFLYIRLIWHVLRAPYLYSVGKGYVPGVYHHPRPGTRQGDPLFPALFSLVASFVIFPLQDLDPGLTVMLYADDFIIFLDNRANPQLSRKRWTPVSCFGPFSGMKVNLNKTTAIVPNCGGQAWAGCFGEIGVDVKTFVKYLGVRLGKIRHHQDDQGWGLTIEQAFAPALQEAFRCGALGERGAPHSLSWNPRMFGWSCVSWSRWRKACLNVYRPWAGGPLLRGEVPHPTVSC